MSVLVTILILMSLLGNTEAADVREKPLSQQEITTAVKNLISLIEQDYIHENLSEKAVTVLSAALNRGEFNGYFPYRRFKIKLESMLFEVTRDSNFELRFRSGLSKTNVTADEIIPGAIHTMMLDNNIGYLAVDGDLIDDFWQTELDFAMTALSDSRALVIDVRDAGLSTLAFSQHILSYFLPPSQFLSKVSLAHQEHIELRSKEIENPINQNVEVYIVTSPFVAGAWEFIAYTLQQAGRATIVGKPTIGLGFMTVTKPLSEQLSIKMAYAKMINPKTQTDWQEEGVVPDVQCGAEEAIAATLSLISQTIPTQCD
ncbi:S41 family peptidase [Alteromonas sediminis]|nr:S41 family peptidase [Alteromonas sediminis]